MRLVDGESNFWAYLIDFYTCHIFSKVEHREYQGYIDYGYFMNSNHCRKCQTRTKILYYL